MKKRSKRPVILGLILILGAGAGLFCALNSHSPGKPIVRTEPAAPVRPPAKTAAKPAKRLTVYEVVVKGDEAKLQPVKVAEIPGKSRYYSALARLIKEGDGAHTANPIPAGTKLLSVKLEDGLATVDLSREFRENFNGGSEGESLTIGAILRTLQQFPEVKRVQLLVEGKPLDTLGHLELSGPLDVKWTGSDLGGEN